jgi:hypothetical protein
MVMRSLLEKVNFLHIGRCNWGTNFTIRGCDLPKSHAGPHRVQGASGLPPELRTREEQEAWVHEHRPPWAR